MSHTAALEAALHLVATTAVDNRDAWDALDSVIADGDFGSTMHRGFTAVLTRWADLDRSSPETLLTTVAEVLSRAMGGTSGPLWTVAFLRAASKFDPGGPPALLAALESAIEGIQQYGAACVGDKTLLDALVPVATALRLQLSDGVDDAAALARAIADAARSGADATRQMPARRGRSAYVGDRSIGAVDPGAAAVAVLVAHLARVHAADVVVPEYLAPSPDRTAHGRAVRASTPKQFLNAPDDAIVESLEGYALAHPGLVVWESADQILRRRFAPAGIVGLVAGGGSGHEPLHGGFIGHGMLTAVAPGPVFASPTVYQILAATVAADAGRGVVHVVKNYTGDTINFGIAAELAGTRGIAVRRVLVNDDVGVDDSLHDIGRRGTGATVVAEKVAGAAAERGDPIGQVVALAERAVDRSASFGIALGSCCPPNRPAILELGPDDIEVGVGIHGEPGRRRDTLRPAADLVREASDNVIDRLEPPVGAELLAIVSGLGATTMMEQHIVYRDLHRDLVGRGFHIARCLVGPYVTALNMPGVLITMTVLDAELLELWDAPVATAALRWGV